MFRGLMPRVLEVGPQERRRGVDVHHPRDTDLDVAEVPVRPLEAALECPSSDAHEGPTLDLDGVPEDCQREESVQTRRRA